MSAEREGRVDDGDGVSRLSKVSALLEDAWARGWCDRPLLEPDRLIDAARRASRLSDFGEEHGWRERLDRLCAALSQEAALNPLGTTVAYGQLVAALAGRLRAEALWRRHPGIAQVPVSAPIIVVGQMRSGSTRMQRLLACDPQFTYTRFFESWNPVRRWDWLPIDDRRVRGWFALRVAHFLNPKFGTIHPVRSRQADEEIGLHNIALYGAAFEAQWRIPSFARHGEAMDSRPIYAEFRRQLQTIRWLRKERGDKPWVLKLPQFSQDLDAVLDTFPDARIVVLHRDPVKIVGSSASLVHNQMAVQSDTVDPRWIGQEWLRKIGLRQERVAQARQRHDVASVDVEFTAMQDDWRGQMHAIYARLGHTLSAETERRMAAYLAKRRHGRLSRHRYDIADYGLTDHQIHAALTSPALPIQRAAA